MWIAWIFLVLARTMKGELFHYHRPRMMLTQNRNDCEYMQMTDTYSPVLHRIDQAVRWRAVHPTEPVPPAYGILTRYSKPPENLIEKSKRRLEKLVAAADVKKGKYSFFYCVIYILNWCSSATQSTISQTHSQRSQAALRSRCRRTTRI